MQAFAEVFNASTSKVNKENTVNTARNTKAMILFFIIYLFKFTKISFASSANLSTSVFSPLSAEIS